MKSTGLATGIIGGQFDIEFRGLTPADRDQITYKLNDNAVVVEGPWSASLMLTINALQPLPRQRPHPGVARSMSRGSCIPGGRVSPGTEPRASLRVDARPTKRTGEQDGLGAA